MLDRSNNKWTDMRLKILDGHIETRMTATEIAAAMSTPEAPVSRNSVLSVVHRTNRKLHNSHGAGAHTPSMQPANEDRRMTQTIRKKARTLAILAQEPTPIVPYKSSDEPPSDTPVSLLELTDATCKFPIGDPMDSDFHFCGKLSIETTPYCLRHCRISYQPPQDRRRAPRA